MVNALEIKDSFVFYLIRARWDGLTIDDRLFYVSIFEGHTLQDAQFREHQILHV